MTADSARALQIRMQKQLKLQPTEEHMKVYNSWLARMLYSKDGEAQFLAYALIDITFHGIHDDDEAFASVITTKGTGINPWQFHLFIGTELLKYSYEEIYQVLRHEIGHVFLLHGPRFPSQTVKLTQTIAYTWNYICDVVMEQHMGIHAALKKMNSKLPSASYQSLISLLQQLGKYINADSTEEYIFSQLLEGLQKKIDSLIPDQELRDALMRSFLTGGEPADAPYGGPGGEEKDETKSANVPTASDNPAAESDTSEFATPEGIIRQLIDELLSQKIMRDIQCMILDEEGNNVPMTDDVRKSLESEVATRAEAAGKAAGYIPGKIQEYIKKIQEPPVIQWNTLVRRGVQAAVKMKKQQSPTRLNYKLGFGYGTAKKRGPRALFMLDTSGSMDSEVLQVAVNELFRLYSMAEAYLVQYDHGMSAEPVRITRTIRSDFVVKGRGGTSVEQAIKDMEAKFDITQFDAVFIFTDFEDRMSLKESPFGRAMVHWFKTDTGHMKPAWGIIVDIAEQIQALVKRRRNKVA